MIIYKKEYSRYQEVNINYDIFYETNHKILLSSLRFNNAFTKLRKKNHFYLKIRKLLFSKQLVKDKKGYFKSEKGIFIFVDDACINILQLFPKHFKIKYGI